MIISWNTTNQCNMYCDHCYRDAGARSDEELSTEQGKQLLDEIIKAGFKIMIFSGGEPFMRDDIFELVEHGIKGGLRVVFGTNGTLITKEVAQKLKDLGVMGVGISLDSLDKAKHDKLRKYKGAWDEAVRGMKNSREVGLPFQIHTTVMDWNDHEVTDMTDFAVDMGAVAHHIFFLVPTGRAVSIEEESLRAEQYEELLERILKKQQEVDIELKPTCAPQFMRIAKQMGMNMRFGRGCLAGTSYCIIGPRGDVQPCAYMDIHIGNVKEEKFSELWADSPTFKELRTMEYKGGCGVCGYKKICGGCRARAAFYNDGDYMAEEPWCLYHGRKGGEGK
ncbi:putative heme d1 biosynthesis radical SAM protein NirJ2 [Metallumcola ferriviriculae]|uniref:Heme d1 biosynthesis radical SAM protein NirJ2 n=1 Tax=Metallumcola ferriviriculae TaxID=3039180 RepID=A0AAU0UQR4_9FIRM|nr:putative heme d1 biosynthesis radical SAM protein NirJ2 [Desulfitibacteraceae bacterium MK1]